MSKPKLTYFDFPASRGEECRIALHVAGVDFEDDRVKFEAWPAMKPTTPFGSLPIFEIEGKGRVAESTAIMTLIGRGHGLHPTDPWEAAHHEALMSRVEMLRHHLQASLHIKDPEEKKKARETLAEGPLADFGRSVNALLGEGPFIAGDQINVADIKLYIIMRAFVDGTIDHVPASVFNDHGRLMKLYNAVHAHPKVAEWNAR